MFSERQIHLKYIFYIFCSRIALMYLREVSPHPIPLPTFAPYLPLALWGAAKILMFSYIIKPW